MRKDKRLDDEMRYVDIQMGYLHNAEGSCLISFGNTRVICSAMCSNNVPQWLYGKNQGWMTAEYSMLPGSTVRRKGRDGVHRDGRGVEIQRLIGRALRGVVDLRLLPDKTVHLDCDVIDADGGTRTASITGAWCAAYQLFDKMVKRGELEKNPLTAQIAAVSCGIVGGTPMLDLCYIEDSSADVDLNIVMTSQGGFVELQGTGEERSFTDEELEVMLRYGRAGINELFAAQREVTGWEQP